MEQKYTHSPNSSQNKSYVTVFLVPLSLTDNNKMDLLLVSTTVGDVYPISLMNIHTRRDHLCNLTLVGTLLIVRVAHGDTWEKSTKHTGPGLRKVKHYRERWTYLIKVYSVKYSTEATTGLQSRT